MAAVTNLLGKENIPPGQKKPRRMKMVLAEDEDDAVVRFATPQKKPLLAAPSVAPATPAIPLPIASAALNAESDEDAVVVIKPRSPRSPSLAVAPAIAEEARRVLAETPAPAPAPAPILAPETPSVSILVPDAPATDEAAPSAEGLLDDCAAVEAEQVEEATAALAPPVESADVIVTAELGTAAVEEAVTSVDSTPDPVRSDEQKSGEESSVQTADAPTETTEENHEIPLAAEAEARSAEGIKIEAATEEEAPASAEEVKCAVVEVPEEKSEATAISPVDASATIEPRAPIDKSEESPEPAVEAEKEEPKCIEEQRAEELAARSAARIEAEAAAQARGALLEARLAELQKLNLPHSEAARATRSAVEERLAAVEEAWRKRIEAKTSANAVAAVAADGAVSGSGAPPPSPSIEERKQRIERLRTERMEMKQRLETSRATSGLQRREASKKKSLRWADDAGDRLTKARSYVVGSGERVVPGAAPPPLPETPAPTEIPARYLEI